MILFHFYRSNLYSMQMLTLFFITFAAHAVLAARDCTKDEFICRGKCTELVRCTTVGNGTIVDQVVRRCPGTISQFCNATARDCGGGSCEDAGIEPAVLACYENGTFPHPTHCDRFFSCNNTRLLEFVCPGNTSYNALHKNCSSTHAARSCTEAPIEPCQSVDHIGGYKEDPTIFYMCAYDVNGYLRPQFHHCDGGYVFDTESERCVENGSAVIYAGFVSIALSLLLIVIS